MTVTGPTSAPTSTTAEHDHAGRGTDRSRRRHVTVAIVGAGFAGLAMAIRLKQAGIDDFVVLERGDDVGGTWRDNTYPGAACDVPSHLYSFSFAPNPRWSRSFSPQGEILDYMRATARRYGVLPHIRFGTPVTAMRWVDDADVWQIDTTSATGNGDGSRATDGLPGGGVTARFLVPGLGALSEPKLPDIPGIDSFAGTLFHSAAWNHDHDLTGETVAVIGTGASSIQFVPEIQPRIGKIHLFQRTPPWVVPRTDRPITGVEQRLFRLVPAAQRLARAAIYWGRELYAFGFQDPKRMRAPEKLARAHLERQVTDPDLRARLTPDYTIGCKRILISNDWYPALTEPNVEVVTDGIAEVRPQSIVTRDGVERPVDTIICGTGFHVTDYPAGDHIHGRGGVTLSEHWAERGSMEAYLGTAVAGFPNLFLLVGPNTGLGHTSMVFMIESQVNYVLDALRHIQGAGATTVEVRREAQDAYNRDLQRRLAGTVWNSGGCRSWYLDANGRNTSLWPGYTWQFRRRTRRFDPWRYVMRYAPTRPELAGTADATR
jgi:cation diffusion facilitator CzcD-associated flavoprotein CzcO